jgi:uncharacterized coiled-coil protein SlyX
MDDIILITARRTTELTQQLSEIQQELAQMAAQNQQLTEQLKRIGSQPSTCAADIDRCSDSRLV